MITEEDLGPTSQAEILEEIGGLQQPESSPSRGGRERE